MCRFMRQEATAGEMLAQRATSPTDLLDTLDSGPVDLVLGSNPASANGDIGLCSLEREVQTQSRRFSAAARRRCQIASERA